jgi:excisionase family DNA binding protein
MEADEHGRQQKNGSRIDCNDYAPNVAHPSAIPFAQRLTCTIAEACEVTGLGRTKLYELIAEGHLATTTVGRRRLVLVRSLLSLLEIHSSEANGT